MRLSSLSTDYVKIPCLSAIVNGEAIDPTSDIVRIAVTDVGTDPVALDWQVADWETNVIDGIPEMRLLVTKGDLAKGTYSLWAEVQDNPETHVEMVGFVEVY